MSLTKEAILACNDLPIEELVVPEWNGSVFIRAMTGAERQRFEDLIVTGTLTVTALVALCTVDEKGAKMFDDADVERLSGKNGKVLQRIAKAALDFNKLAEMEIEAEKKD